tara:strand:+ start:97 stop:483 length:387 start_codon:yes stop_codon:yes gene_type:complete
MVRQIKNETKKSRFDKLVRKEAINRFEQEINIWRNSKGFQSYDIRLYDFLMKTIKRKTKAPAYNKLKKEVQVLIKWGVLYDAFGFAILKEYGYETYLKLYQDIEGTHQVIDEFMTIETAEREDIAGHI